MWSVEINEEYQFSPTPKFIVCRWLLLIETIQPTSSKSTWIEPMLRCCNRKIIQNNTVKKYQIWKEGKDSMIFPSNLTLVGSIIVNHIFVSTTQHWIWIANSGFWFNPYRFWLSGWSCFNQKQPTTDYELRSWQELIFLIYFDGPHLFFNCFLDTWGIFL